jgi:pimeloyl-ACP methyl ester carboxylesterase
MRHKGIIIQISITLILLFFGCTEENNFSPQPRSALLEVIERGRLTQSEIVARMNELDGSPIVKHDVTFYAITYRTSYMGRDIDSRGLIIIPDGVDDANLLMYTHGTELPSEILGARDISPSNYAGETDTNRDVRNMGLGWASAGYVVFMPDYIGYGITIGTDHPYMYMPEMFISNVDGLLAAKTFIRENTSLSYDNRLFLTGWSQGGAASLSTHRYLQEQYPAEFKILGSSHLAGPHNFERFHDDIMARGGEEVLIMPIFSWAVYSINKFSELKRPTDQLYNYPVFDQMSSLFTPSSDPEKVFKGFFRAKVLNGEDQVYRNVLQNNSNHNGWLPTGKVILHHGDEDDIVPYFNSIDARDGLTAAGGDVVLYTYPGGGHTTELGNFIINTITEFNQLK